MTPSSADRPTMWRSALAGWARRPLSSPVCPTTPTAKPRRGAGRGGRRSVARRARRASLRRSPSSCAAPRRPARATPSISTRRRSTARGRFRGLAERRAASACRLDRRRRPAARGERASKRCAWRARSRTTSFDPNIRPLVTPDRESVRRSSNARSRWPVSSRRARKICAGSIPIAIPRPRSPLGAARPGTFA